MNVSVFTALLSLFAVPLLVPPSALAASFNCARAKSDAEHLICHDTQLSRLDDELKVLFDAARDAAVDKKKFKQSADASWRWREQHCHTKECLVDWFVQRKKDLSTASPAGSVLALSTNQDKPTRPNPNHPTVSPAKPDIQEKPASASTSSTSTKLTTVSAADSLRVRQQILRRLKDPDSARFGDILVTDQDEACIPVNARNSFGGYTGDRFFSLQRTSSGWAVDDSVSHEFGHSLCEVRIRLLLLQRLGEKQK